MTPSVWEQRDLPVLQALASSEDENLKHGFLSISTHSDNTLGLALPASAIFESILTLADVGYVDGELSNESGGSVTFTRLVVTGRGQQALGEWPLFDELASPETLALLLERLAEEAPTREEEDNLKRAARYARTVGAATLRALAVGATSQLVRNAAGL
jgi:hypothetical protein